MAEKYNLEIEKSIEWMLYRPSIGYQDYHNGHRILDIGIDLDWLADWKEYLGNDVWLKEIDLDVYIEDDPIYDIPKQGFSPKSTFKTTIGGALEYLMANRAAFGFTPKN
jgi:hypothetical protein